MKCRQVLDLAVSRLERMRGRTLDAVDIARPDTPEEAVNLVKVISKLSPLLGNLLEFKLVTLLNAEAAYRPHGRWKRQDPGFPDAVFEGSVTPMPGLEIKTWFPLASEITARFKSSQTILAPDRTWVCLLAWLPTRLIFGRPRVLDVCVIPGSSVAAARDRHYHDPPEYLVLEPEDTSGRTANLQQTNVNGYKFQGTAAQLAQARKRVRRWGRSAREYRTDPRYQARLRRLQAAFPYRGDTNFAKMDRIMHPELEAFKERILQREVHGRSVQEWRSLRTASGDQAPWRRLWETAGNQKRSD